jgi:hypothetical protein
MELGEPWLAPGRQRADMVGACSPSEKKVADIDSSFSNTKNQHLFYRQIDRNFACETSHSSREILEVISTIFALLIDLCCFRNRSKSGDFGAAFYPDGEPTSRCRGGWRWLLNKGWKVTETEMPNAERGSLAHAHSTNLFCT